MACAMRQTVKQRVSQCKILLQILLGVLLFSLPSHSLIADTFSDRRALVGLKLFRTLVGADLNVSNKLNPSGQLPVYLLYVHDDGAAKGYRESLANTFTSVRSLPVHINVQTVDKLLATGQPEKPAAIFITEQITANELQRLVDYSIENHVIVFSPFEGDVERGVLAGLSVEATVRPLINMNTLVASELTIKSFYLKVAKPYE